MQKVVLTSLIKMDYTSTLGSIFVNRDSYVRLKGNNFICTKIVEKRWKKPVQVSQKEIFATLQEFILVQWLNPAPQLVGQVVRYVRVQWLPQNGCAWFTPWTGKLWLTCVNFFHSIVRLLCRWHFYLLMKLYLPLLFIEGIFSSVC